MHVDYYIVDLDSMLFQNDELWMPRLMLLTKVVRFVVYACFASLTIPIHDVSSSDVKIEVRI